MLKEYFFKLIDFFRKSDLVALSEEKYKREKTIVFPNENPLEPYFKEKMLSSNLSSMGTPMSFKEYNKLFHELVGIKNFLNEDKEPVLKKIYDDMRFIYDQLKPLEDLGIKFTLDLTGGSVRDFILNKHHEIKDLDVMISLPTTSKYDYKEGVSYSDFNEHSINEEKLLKVFTKDELREVNWSDVYPDPSGLYKINQLIQLCFLKSKTISETFLHDRKKQNMVENDDSNKDYTKNVTKEERLVGVIKLDDSKTNFGIDLLMTHQIKPVFLENFDFNFCKASFCFVNPVVKKEFPKNHSHLISRFSAKDSFFADILHKKITINVDCDRPKMSLIRSASRAIKFLKKYPDYSLNVVSDKYCFSNERREIFDRSFANFNLEDKVASLPKNEEQLSIKAKKI